MYILLPVLFLPVSFLFELGVVVSRLIFLLFINHLLHDAIQEHPFDNFFAFFAIWINLGFCLIFRLTLPELGWVIPTLGWFSFFLAYTAAYVFENARFFVYPYLQLLISFYLILWHFGILYASFSLANAEFFFFHIGSSG